MRPPDCENPENTLGYSYKKGCRCPDCRANNAEKARGYRKTEGGKESARRYDSSEKGKARKSRSNKRQRSTDIGFLRVKHGGMVFRCKPDQDYGSRGIRNEFESVDHFIEWALGHPSYAHGKEIHRKDKDGNYSPENCIFVTNEEHKALTAKERGWS